MTATVYLVARVDGEVKVLLHKHKKHTMWLGIGGHVEKQESPPQAAVREVKEEAGIDVELFTDKKDFIKTQYVAELVQPFIILEEKILAQEDKPEHRHVDCIYFAVVQNPQDVTMQEEFRWLSFDELKKLELQKEVRYNAEHAIKICNSHI